MLDLGKIIILVDKCGGTYVFKIKSDVRKQLTDLGIKTSSKVTISFEDSSYQIDEFRQKFVIAQLLGDFSILLEKVKFESVEIVDVNTNEVKLVALAK